MNRYYFTQVVLRAEGTQHGYVMAESLDEAKRLFDEHAQFDSEEIIAMALVMRKNNVRKNNSI